MDQGNRALQGRRQYFGEGTSPFGHPATSYSREGGGEGRSHGRSRNTVSSPLCSHPVAQPLLDYSNDESVPSPPDFSTTIGQLTWFRSSFSTLKHWASQTLGIFWTSILAQLVKSLPEMWETWVRSLGWEHPPGEGKAYPLQYSGLENFMDCIVNGVAKSQIRLSDFHFTTCILGLLVLTSCFWRGPADADALYPLKPFRYWIQSLWYRPKFFLFQAKISTLFYSCFDDQALTVLIHPLKMIL